VVLCEKTLHTIIKQDGVFPGHDCHVSGAKIVIGHQNDGNMQPVLIPRHHILTLLTFVYIQRTWHPLA